MANPEHLEILKKGVEAWNEWRKEKPNVVPDLTGADLRSANFSGANLSGANLVEANLSFTNLTRASFQGTDLTRAGFILANLTEALLYRANLTGANLTDANLTKARLVRANLTDVFLISADLTDADLTSADLTGGILYGTILADVNLSTVIGLEQVRHLGPSSIGTDTLYNSKGNIPEVFLRGAGVPDDMVAFIATLRGKPIEFYSCFISYSHKDKSFARRLHDGLQGRGIRCWLDEHQLLPGQKIHVEVDRGIRIWDKVLLCCSEHSLTSWWVNNEINLAIQKEQRLWEECGEDVLALIPLNLDGYMFGPKWRSGWKGQITERLAADFTDWEHDNQKFEEQFERVVKALMTDDRGREAVPPPRLGIDARNK